MRAITTVLLAGFVLCLSGCGDSHDKAVADSVALMSDMNDILDKVKDVDSAQSAVTQLNALKSRAESMQERIKKLGKPSPDVDKALKEKYEPAFKKELKRMHATKLRFATNKEVMQILMKSMGNFGRMGKAPF